MLRRSGPHLAPKAPANFFGIRQGVKTDFTLCVYAQNAQNFMGNSNTHAKQEKKTFTPDPPPPPSVHPPPNLAAGTGSLVGKPHMCVFTMISATRGSF